MDKHLINNKLMQVMSKSTLLGIKNNSKEAERLAQEIENLCYEISEEVNGNRVREEINERDAEIREG